MSYQLEREALREGIWFSSVTDKKFKHNRLSANLIVQLDRETVTTNALLPFLLRKGCRAYPDFTALNRKLAELYGAMLDADVVKSGDYHILSLCVQGIDDRFALDNEDMIAECAALLCELVLHPNLVDGAFPEKDVELERQFIIDTIEAEINDKRSYAVNRCVDVMCAGEPASVKKYGYVEKAREITPRSAAEAYAEILRTARIELLFVGCGDPAAAKALFREQVAALDRAPAVLQQLPRKASADTVRTEIEEMEIAQGKLVMGFRTGGELTGEEFSAMRVMAALYGGTPFSRLFLNVREKMSLCYYCAARYNHSYKAMFVDSGVEVENYERAREEILHQLEAMRQGEFTDEDLVNTKLLLKTGLRAVTDSLGAIENWYMSKILEDSALSPQEDIANIEAVTREQVIAAAQRVTLDTVYFLKGKEEA